MRKFSYGLIALAVAVLALISLQRRQNTQPHSLTFTAMDTVMAMTAYGTHAPDALISARERVRTIEDEISTTRDESDVGRLNSADGTDVAVGSDTAELMAFALELSNETDRAFDPTLYPLLRAWGFTTGDYRVPPHEELERLKALTGPNVVTQNGQTLSLRPGSMIDFGALGKGFAGDAALELLRRAGVSSAIINLGGNVQTLGKRPDWKLWRIGIAAPDGGLLGVLETGEGAVITSGGYQRYFAGEDGTVYWHILDPATGAPARSGILSATVAAPSGLLADGLSTAFFVMGAEKAAEWQQTHRGVDFILYTDDNEFWITERLEKHFTPDPAYADATVKVIKR